MSNAKFDMLAAFGLGLSRMDREMRAHYIGGSDANTIAKGSDWEITKLIAIKRGEVEPDDLSRNIAVMLGTWTEPFNAWLYEQFTDIPVTDRNAVFDHPFETCYRASVDGMVHLPETGRAVWEAKYTSATNLETVTKTYMGQLVSNMDCCGVDHAVLSVILGGNKYQHVVVEMDHDYLAALRARTDLVWRAIQSDDGVLEGPLPEMPKPTMPPVFLRSEPVDLTTVKGANEIGSLAPDYILTYEAAKLHGKVAKKLKGLIPEDAADVTGFGLRGTRNAAGALTLVPAITTVEEAVTEPAANDDHLSY